MFGQTGNTSFGGFNTATQSSPFGQTAFGKPITTTSFGSGAAPVFGSGNTSLFSAKPAGPTTGGLFGNTTGTSAFGQPTTTQSSFGGFTTTNTNTNLFGAQQNANTNLFGSTTATPAFGQANKPTGFGFGGTTGNTLFGQPQQQQQQPTPFGQANTNTNTNLFGTTGGFGATNNVTGMTGTVIKFTPVNGTDTMVKGGVTQNISTRHHCITCMKEYESKSLEELRFEDYTSGRKGSAQGQNTGLFGAPTQPSPFGSTTAGTSTATTGFGGMAGFGTNNQTASTGLFGKPITGFGAPTTTATNGFAFNSTASTNLFGPNTQAKPFGGASTTSLFPTSNIMQTPGTFGSVTAPQNTAFGTTFGTTQPNQNIGLFNQNKSTFNMPTSSAPTAFPSFGQATATNTGSTLFGTKPAGTTGFGTTSTFGAPTSSAFGINTGFNSGQNAGTSLFNSSFKPAGQTTGFPFGTTPASSTGLGLGTNTSLNLTGGTSLFGQQKPGGLFGTTSNTAFNTPGTFGTSSVFGANTNSGTGLGLGSLGGGLLSNQIQNTGAVPVHQQILALVSAPFGDSPLLKNLLPAAGKTEELLKPSNPTVRGLNSPQYKVASNNKSPSIKAKIVSAAQLSKKSLFEGLEEKDSALLEAFQPRPNAKRLVLRPKLNSQINSPDENNHSSIDDSTNNTSTNNIESTNKENYCQESVDQSDDRRVSWIKSLVKRVDTINSNKETEEDHSESLRRQKKNDLKCNNYYLARRESGTDSESLVNNTIAELRPNSFINSPNQSRSDLNNSGQAFISMLNTSSEATLNSLSDKNKSDCNPHTSETQESDESTWSTNAANIILHRSGYYTIPPLDKLDDYVSGESCIVPNFTIGRKGYGNVFYPDSFDIYGLNLDEIVHFRHKEVVIYPDDAKKPPVGQGLNRKAQVTLECVWPHDKSRHEPITDPTRLAEMNFEEKLRRVCAKHDTRFLEYRPETGSWVFKVDHFSKYGLSDSDEDDANAPPRNELNKKKAISSSKVAMDVQQSSPKCQKSWQASSVNKKDTPMETENNLNASREPKEMIVFSELFAETPTSLKRGYSEEKRVALSPTAAYACITGTDSHKLQLMKASFFDTDGDYDSQGLMYGDISVTMQNDYYTNTDNYPASQGQKISNIPLFRKEFQIDRIPTPIEKKTYSQSVKWSICDEPKDPTEIKKALPDHAPTPVTTILKCHSEVMPLEKTIGHKLHFRCIADAGIQMGRMFKCSWGPGLTLLSLSTQDQADKITLQNKFSQLGIYVSGRNSGDFTSTRVVQRIKILGGTGASERDIDIFKESIEGHLNVQLNHCIMSKNDGDCPKIYVSSETSNIALQEHYMLAEKLTEQSDADNLTMYTRDVLQLCVALWKNLSDESVDGEHDSHYHVMERREAVGEWLKNVIEPVIEKEILNITNDEEIIFSKLCALKLEDACQIARKNGDYCLALLMSQLRSGLPVRELVKQQLALWQKTKVDERLSVERLKLYMLVAAESLIYSVHGTINVFENLDWRKALAIHLWYLSPPTCSVADALELYEMSFVPEDVEVEPYAAKPKPEYKENDFDAELSNGRNVYDLCFHLLKLYCTGNHPLEQLLNPLTYTADPLDYRLSWIIQEILVALGYNHLSEYVATLTHVNFATQLEAYGLWHWAVFVMMHLEDSGKRKAAVISLLERHVSICNNCGDEFEMNLRESEYEKQEEFLIKNLHVPTSWIDNAKAVKCCVAKRYGEAACYYIKAEEWNSAHDVIIDHIAADSIINEHYTYLRKLLTPMVQAQCSNTISGWSHQGQLLWDYMEITMKIEELLKTKETIDSCGLSYKLEMLKPQINFLCLKINQFPCPTAKHRLCQAEIAKRTLHLAKSLLKLQSNEAVSTTVILTQLISQLPLPEDYAQQELRPIVNMCVNEVITLSV
ncbi:nuclear pore complex protein Nup98-Nup96 isoform X2 [Prorops nasuta]|uniref:nuclear pore complex protein Nup98-Nup96 isoform X2 n=1 Tax=Prorops nasuta TaxID=863751 RepID=UPI0034CF317A